MRVFKYGLLPPTKNADLVFDQMRKANRYRNDLIQIANEEKKVIRTLEVEPIKHLKDAADIAQMAVEECLLRMKKVRSALKVKSDTPALKKELSKLKSAQKEERSKLYLAQKEVRAAGTVKIEVEAIRKLSDMLQKNLGKHSGVYWSTKALIQDAMKISIASSWKKDYIPFKRWSGEGQISNQIQSKTGLDKHGNVKPNAKPIAPMLSEEVFGNSHSQIRIAPVSDSAWSAGSRGDRKRAQRTVLSFRVGSDDKHKPIWAEFPMIMHRPLPANSTIKRATVSRRINGLRAEWSIEITIDDTLSPKKELGIGLVAIDIGWRKMKNENIRVATTYDGTENSFIEISTKRLDKADELRGLRDDLFNVIKKEYAEMDKTTFPDWIRSELTYIDKWKQSKRLFYLVKRWKANRVTGDDTVYAHFEKWRYTDQHLYNYEAGNRRSGLRERKDVYRNIAANMSKAYSKVILEEIDLSKMAKKPELSSEKDLSDTSRRQRFQAANSELREAIENCFGKENVIRVNPAYTSRTCFECKEIQTLDHTTPIHICKDCGVEWDRDENASKNIRERGVAAIDAVTARNNENANDTEVMRGGKWTNRKKSKEARILLEETARKADAKPSERLVS